MITLVASDADNDPLTYTDQDPSNGTLSGTAPNLTYSPNGGFVGTDSFTFVANDGQVDSLPATITIMINPVQDPPLALDDAGEVNEDFSLVLDVLANDSDIDSDPLLVSTASAANGTVTINPDGTLNYTPDSGYFGADTISYTAVDGNGGTAIGSVAVTVEENPAVSAPQVTTPQVRQPQPEAQQTVQNENTAADEPQPAASDSTSLESSSEIASKSETTTEPETTSLATNIESLIDADDSTIGDDSQTSTFAVPEINNPRAEGGEFAFSNPERSHTPESVVELMQLQALQDQMDNQLKLSLWEDNDGDIQQEQQLWSKLEQMQDGMDKNMAKQQQGDIDVHIALGSTASLTVGFVSWILRGGSLLASLITTLPLLNRFDPLPVIKSNDKKKEEVSEDDNDDNQSPEERVEEMFSGKSEPEE